MGYTFAPVTDFEKLLAPLEKLYGREKAPRQLERYRGLVRGLEETFGKAERCALLDEALRGQVDPYLLNFLKILCENGTLRQLSACEKEFSARYNAARGILPAKAVSAVPLTEDAAARLKAKLESLTGKTVDLSFAVDPACLGGIRLEMDGVRFDGTVEGRLARLRRDLENIVL